MGSTPPPPERSIARDAAASVGARIVAMVVSSMTALVIGAALPKQEYGTYALAAGLVGVLAVALDLGTTSSLARFVSQGRGSLALVWRIIGARFGLLAIGVSALVAVGVPADSRGDGFAHLLLPAAPLLAGLGAMSFLFGSLPSMRRIRLLLVVTVVQPLLELGLVIWVLTSDGDRTGMVLLASAGAAIVAAVIGYVALLVRPSAMLPSVTSSEPAATLADVLHYSRRIFLVLLLMMVFGQLDQFVIQAFHGAADVAPYALAIKLQALVIAPAITITGIVAPRVAGAGVHALHIYRRWLTGFVVVYLGAAFVFAVLARDVFTAINPAYRGDANVLVALLPFIFLGAVSTLPSVSLNQIGYAGSRLRIVVVALGINIVLDLALVPWLAAFGAAIGTTVAFAYYAWAHHRRLDAALLAASDSPAPKRSPGLVLVPGAVSAIVVTAVAYCLKRWIELLEIDNARGEAITIVLVSAGVAAAMHLFVTAQLLRRNQG